MQKTSKLLIILIICALYFFFLNKAFSCTIKTNKLTIQCKYSMIAYQFCMTETVMHEYELKDIIFLQAFCNRILNKQSETYNCRKK